MKKGWKIFWIVCGATAVVGFACCAAAWGLGITAEAVYSRFPNGIGFVSTDSAKEVDGEKYIAPDINETFEGVKELNIDLFAGQVEVRATSGNNITVETKGISEKLGFKCRMDGNELKLTSKERLFRINNVGIGKIYVDIPKDLMLEEADIDVGAGTLYIEDISARELNVDVGAGEVSVDNFYAGEADFDCGAGSITASGDVERELGMDCMTGEIIFTITGKEEDYNYDIECGVGEVICGEYSFSGLAREQTIDNRADKEIHIDCGIGSIEVEFEDRVS